MTFADPPPPESDDNHFFEAFPNIKRKKNIIIKQTFPYLLLIML